MRLTSDSAVHPLPPVIVFGGNDNAISIVRSLGARPIPVFTLNTAQADVHYSRYARRIRCDRSRPFIEAATSFLLSEQSDFLAGAVLLAASDEALEVLYQHRQALAKKFRLDLSNPVAQRMMLDKLETYKLACEVDVPTPRFWQLQSPEDFESFRAEIAYPVIVKPKLSHLFQQRFNSKFLFAKDERELNAALKTTARENIEVMLVEFIPGPDSQLCSYYTYLDENGKALFDFTKRIIRRYPTNMGLACFHVTDHVPQVGELSRRLFERADLRGLANAEFKLDKRDNRLKLIECNARFTAANGLVAKSGIDLSSFVYNRIVGISQPLPTTFRDGLHLWDPIRDFQAYRELRRLKQLTLVQWLRSVMVWQLFPAFAWHDPLPSCMRLWKRFRKSLSERFAGHSRPSRWSSLFAKAMCALGLGFLLMFPFSFFSYSSFGFDIEYERGEHVVEDFYRIRWPGDGSCRLGSGSIHYALEEEDVDVIDIAGRLLEDPQLEPTATSWNRFAFDEGIPEGNKGELKSSAWFIVPSWFPAAVLTAISLLWMRSLRTTSRTSNSTSIPAS